VKYEVFLKSFKNKNKTKQRKTKDKTNKYKKDGITFVTVKCEISTMV
jgi:hypothetical protein